MQCDSMKVSAIITDKQSPENKYFAVNDVVLKNPPLSVTVSKIQLCSLVNFLTINTSKAVRGTPGSQFHKIIKFY